MSRPLELLLRFLRPGVDDPASPPAEDPPADDPADDIVIDEDPPADDPAPPADAARLAAELAEERAARARDKADRDRFEREAAELRIRNQPPQRDAELDEEERVLRDPNATEQQKWTVNANREIRRNRQMAQASIASAADVNDRTAFASICMSDPLAKRYQARVEEELQKVRAAGQNANREAIYTFLLGKDMREGKYRKKGAAPAADPKQAPRGKTPGVRSDVSARTTLTEREKRRQRLENRQI